MTASDRPVADPSGDLDALFQSRAPVEPPKAVSDAICRHCTKSLHPGRGASAEKRVLLSLLISGGLTGLLIGFGVVRGSAGATLSSALYGAAGWALIQAFVLVVGLARPPGRKPARAVRLVMAVVVPILFLGYLALTASGRLPFETFSQGATASHAVGCGLVSLFLGALVSGGVLLLWRGTDPLTPGLSGALVGLVGGLGGAVAIGIACPSHEAWHLGFSHGLGVVALVFLGGAVGRRLLCP
ncbi:MAG TPA: NrsF family protein [Polyangiaceae bacterium]